MAKTFDNISEASATNCLFLVAQRTLALQNEPPTPPPLNALGLPCKGMYLLWEWAQKLKRKVKHGNEGDEGNDGDEGEGGGCKGSVAEDKTRAEAKAAEDAALKAADGATEEDAEVDAALEAAGDALKAAAEAEVAGKMQPLTAPEAAQAADDDALKAVEGALLQLRQELLLLCCF